MKNLLISLLLLLPSTAIWGASYPGGGGGTGGAATNIVSRAGVNISIITNVNGGDYTYSTVSAPTFSGPVTAGSYVIVNALGNFQIGGNTGPAIYGYDVGGLIVYQGGVLGHDFVSSNGVTEAQIGLSYSGQDRYNVPFEPQTKFFGPVYADLVKTSAGQIEDEPINFDFVAQSQPLPMLYFNPYYLNSLQAGVTENIIITNATYFSTNGVAAANPGFMIWLDDGWMSATRDSNHNLQTDGVKFTDSISNVCYFIHTNNVRAGIYIAYANGLTIAGGAGSGEPLLTNDIGFLANSGFEGITIDNNTLGTADYNFYRQKFRKVAESVLQQPSKFNFPVPGSTTNASIPSTMVIRNFSGALNSFYPWFGTLMANIIPDGGPKYGCFSFSNTLMQANEDLRFLPNFTPGHCHEDMFIHSWDLSGNGDTNRIKTCITLAALFGSSAWMDGIGSGLYSKLPWLTNNEVIGAWRDPGCQKPQVVSTNGTVGAASWQEIWKRPLGSANGSTNLVAFINSDAASSQSITATWGLLGFPSNTTYKVRSLWGNGGSGSDLGYFTNTFAQTISKTNVEMYLFTRVPLSSTNENISPTKDLIFGQNGDDDGPSRLHIQANGTGDGIQVEMKNFDFAGIALKGNSSPAATMNAEHRNGVVKNAGNTFGEFQFALNGTTYGTIGSSAMMNNGLIISSNSYATIVGIMNNLTPGQMFTFVSNDVPIYFIKKADATLTTNLFSSGGGSNPTAGTNISVSGSAVSLQQALTNLTSITLASGAAGINGNGGLGTNFSLLSVSGSGPGVISANDASGNTKITISSLGVTNLDVRLAGSNTVNNSYWEIGTNGSIFDTNGTAANQMFTLTNGGAYFQGKLQADGTATFNGVTNNGTLNQTGAQTNFGAVVFNAGASNFGTFHVSAGAASDFAIVPNNGASTVAFQKPGAITYFTFGATVITPGLPIVPAVVTTTTVISRTLAGTDGVVIFNGTSLTCTLPTAIGKGGQMYWVKNINATALTIATTSSQTIDGTTPVSLTVGQARCYHSDGANWFIIGGYL